MQLLLFGFAIEPGPLAAIAFRGLQDAAPLLVGVDRPLYACHGCSYSRSDVNGSGTAPGSVPGPLGSAVEQRVAPLGVVGCNRRAAVQPPGSFGRLVLEQVPTIGFLAHDLCGSGAAEPLGRTAVGLGLWHISSSSAVRSVG